jgi:hypothetical protein
LNETKEVVRRKLGLASDAVIHLTQLREGKNIDLDDGSVLVMVVNSLFTDCGNI